MGAAREKDQADFDLEQFIDLFDEALTSNDPRVKQALGHLMTITALTLNHLPNRHDKRTGPLRRIFDDQYEIIRRIERLENDSRAKYEMSIEEKHKMLASMLDYTQSPVPPPLKMSASEYNSIIDDPNYRGSSLGTKNV